MWHSGDHPLSGALLTGCGGVDGTSVELANLDITSPPQENQLRKLS
jgi:hypothetical protein